MRIKLNLVLYLIILLSFSVVGTGLILQLHHIEHDDHDCDHCSVCLKIFNFTGDIPEYHGMSASEFVKPYHIKIVRDNLVLSQHLFCFLNRGPPVA